MRKHCQHTVGKKSMNASKHKKLIVFETTSTFEFPRKK